MVRNVSYIFKINEPGVLLKVRIAFGNDGCELSVLSEGVIISVKTKNVEDGGESSSGSSLTLIFSSLINQIL